MKKSLVFTLLLLTAPAVLAGVNIVATLPDFGAIAGVIGGSKVEVTTIARGTEDAHFVDARPSFVRVLNRADLLIESGAELEIGWLPPLVTAARNRKIQGVSNGHLLLAPAIRLLDVPDGPVDRSMGDVHSRGNPHFWLDPRNGKIIAEQIAARLRQLDPPNAAHYQSNLESFHAQLDARWEQWAEKLQPYRGTKVITYHKSYEYLADAFGFEIVGQLEPRPGIEPSASHINQLVQQAKDTGVKLVLIEPFRPRRTGQQVAQAIGAKFLLLPDKTGSTEEASDYFRLFDTIVNRLAEVLPAAK